MLQGFPAYAIHSAMHFEDYVYWPPVAREAREARGSGTGKKTRPGKPKPAGEEEDYVFV